jgi:hypothetical protein
VSASVVEFARLAHRVWEFLAAQSNDALVALADGRLRLSLIDPVHTPAESTGVVFFAAPAEETHPVVPAPQAKRARHPRAAAPRPAAAAPVLAVGSPDVAEIADVLRGMESVDAGATYLASLKLRIVDLVAIGAVLGVTVPKATRKDGAVRMVLNQAIGARRKFAGLSSW